MQVEGRGRASREAVLNAVAVARGTPILAVDPIETKQRLEAVPWIRSASVERRLPDTLYIRLVERQPLAFWQRQGKLVLIDRDGVVIPTERLDSFGNLIVLVGPDAPANGAALIDMLATEPHLAAHVAAAVRVGGRRWNLRLDNNVDIALPEDDPTAGWRRLAQLERSDGILEREIQAVDLRLPDRLVVPHRSRNAEAEGQERPAAREDDMKKLATRPRSTVGVIDIGTSKVCCFIARRIGNEPHIIGIGHQVSRGVRNGVIVDIEAASHSILNAIHAAEQMAGETLERDRRQPVRRLRRLAHLQGRDQSERPRDHRHRHAARARAGHQMQGAARSRGDPFDPGRLLDRRQPRHPRSARHVSASGSASTCMW